MDYEPEFEESEHFADAPDLSENFQETQDIVDADAHQAPPYRNETQEFEDLAFPRPQIENFETIEDYESAVAQYESRPQLTPWKDDPSAAQRQDLDNWLKECSVQETMARDAGDSAQAKVWAERGRMALKDLRDLGPSEREKFLDAANFGQLEQAMDFLTSPENIGNQAFSDERMQNDAGVLLDRHNRESQGRIVLPVEDSRHGNIAPVAPGNMIVFELSPDQAEGLREMVYHSGGPADLDSVFRASWDYLRQIGVDTSGHRVRAARKGSSNRDDAGRYVKSVTQAPEPIRPTGGTTEFHKDPGSMSQGDYEAWRNESS